MSNVAPIISEEQKNAWRDREYNRMWGYDNAISYTRLPTAWSEATWFIYKLGRGPRGAEWDMPREQLYTDAHSNHYAHVSLVDGAMVAFTENDAKGVADRQTRMKPGKYLKKYFGDVLSAERITELATAFCAEFKPMDLKFAADADDIEHVYRHGPNSCMSYSADGYSGSCHPVRAYAGPDLQIAYIGRDADNITARCVVWPSKKVHTRIYGDELRLRPLLEAAGYSKGTLHGARMTAIKDDGDDGYVVPYVDCCTWAEADGGFLHIGHGDIHLKETNGVSGDRRQRCACCDVAMHEDYSFYCDDDGETMCESCDGEHRFMCEYDGASHSGTRVEMANGDTWCEYNFDRYGFTCPITNENYPDSEGVEMADGETWSNDAFSEHGFTCEGNGGNYHVRDLIVMADGQQWSREHFDDNGHTNDEGENVENADAPLPAKPYHCPDTLELPLPAPVTPGQIAVGDWVECVASYPLAGQFTRGKLYQVSRVYEIEPHYIGVFADDSGDANCWAAENFRLVNIPLAQAAE
jgi:hypothetical protein